MFMGTVGRTKTMIVLLVGLPLFHSSLYPTATPQNELFFCFFKHEDIFFSKHEDKTQPWWITKR